MFSQPSIKDIASLYQGNPGALEQRIQKEEQAKPGIPPDLQKLLALQILTSEDDAMKRNQALQKLQQVSNQPTVAENVEMKAKQALQSRMMQEQQKQQGLQALAQQAQSGQIPAGVPQPVSQPDAQGLDVLTSNIGQNLAGGGIIAFEDGGDVQADDPKTEAIRAKIKAAILARVNEMKKSGHADEGIMGFNGKGEQGSTVPELDKETADDIFRRIQERTENKEEESGITKAFKFLGNAGLTALKHALNYPGTGLSSLRDTQPNADLVPLSQTNEQPKRVAGMTQQEVFEAARKQDEKSGIQRTPQEQAEANAVIKKRFEGANPDAVVKPPAPPVAPTAPVVSAKPPVPAAAPAAAAPQGIMDAAEQKKNLDIIRARRDLDPAARERLMRERFEKEVGAPDTTGLQSLAEEIAARRQKIAERADPIQDLLRGTALAPKGERWMFSGSRGADYADKQQAARDLQDFELAKSLFETQAKISDVKRGWKKDVFTIGREEFNTVYKEAYDAAKEMGRTDDAAKKLAQDAVLDREKMANALATARISAGPQLAAGARIDKAIADLMKNNTEMSYAEAYEAVTKPASYLAPNKQTLAELKTLAENLRIMADPMKNPDPDSQKEAARQLAIVTAKIAEMAKVDLGSAPPPGAVRLKPKQ
jgi:hypothetical protein